MPSYSGGLEGSIVKLLIGYAAASTAKAFASKYRQIIKSQLGGKKERHDVRWLLELLARTVLRQFLSSEEIDKLWNILEGFSDADSLAGIFEELLRRIRQRNERWKLLVVLDVYAISGGAESTIVH